MRSSILSSLFFGLCSIILAPLTSSAADLGLSINFESLGGTVGQLTVATSRTSSAILIDGSDSPENGDQLSEGLIAVRLPNQYDCVGHITCSYSYNGVVVLTRAMLCDEPGRGICEAACPLSMTWQGNDLPLTSSGGPGCSWKEIYGVSAGN